MAAPVAPSEELALPVRSAMDCVDWRASPLGLPSEWTPTLTTVFDLVSASGAQIVLFWGPAFVALYNDAYAPTIGEKHPRALGRPACENWAELWDDLEPLLSGVRETGRAFSAKDRPFYIERRGEGLGETVYFDLSYSAVREADGSVGGVLCIVSETTERVVTARHLAFLQRLVDATREVSDPDAVTQVASALLGPELGVGRVGYAEMDAAGTIVSVARDWDDGTMASLAGEARVLDAFGEKAIAELRQGRTLIVEDCREDPRTADPAFLATWESIGTRALIAVPLLRGDRLRAMLYAHASAPRGWSALDVALAEEVARRTTAAVDRARAEARLRASEARFRLMADAVPQILWVTDIDGNVEFFNRQWFDYTGTTTLPQTSVEVAEAFLHPDDIEATNQAYQAALSEQRPFHVEHRIRGADGRYRWFMVRSEPYVGGPSGKIDRWFGVSIDIHDRKLEEADLRRRVDAALAEKQVFADVVDGSEAAMTVLDLSGRILAINKANLVEMQRIYGRQPAVGDSLFDLVTENPEHRAQLIANWSRALAGEAFEITQTFGDPGLERRTYEVRFSPLRDDSGELIGASSTSYDVTDRVEAAAQLEAAQDQLRQAQKMEAMGQLTGGVAHDFNNLLTPIVGALDVLERTGAGTERQQRLVHGAIQAAERAKTLVQRLLAFARRQPLQTAAVDVAELVRSMADLIASTAGPQFRLVTEVAADLPRARADLNQLEMALLNLGVNARDAMPNGGTIRISAMAEQVDANHDLDLAPGQYLRLSVADTGSGMDEATLARAVEPFFSTKGIGKGTGLGLSMVHGLASQLGGALQIRSRLGMGTNVELWLPVCVEHDVGTEQPVPALPAEAPGAGLVLLVDDEDLVRESTAHMLADLGYRVTEAVSGEDALRQLNEGLAPDILVTDHLMPGMTGTELAQRFREQRPNGAVLIVSGYADSDELLPEFDRLTKPFRSEELAERLRALQG